MGLGAMLPQTAAVAAAATRLLLLLLLLNTVCVSAGHSGATLLASHHVEATVSTCYSPSQP